MSPIKDFTEVVAWQKAHILAVLIYKKTESFPKSELYGLTSQMRRSAISVSSNIAEGFGRRGKADKLRFYDTALSSIYELQSQIVLSRDVGLFNKETYLEIFEATKNAQRLLQGWIKQH